MILDIFIESIHLHLKSCSNTPTISSWSKRQKDWIFLTCQSLLPRTYGHTRAQSFDAASVFPYKFQPAVSLDSTSGSVPWAETFQVFCPSAHGTWLSAQGRVPLVAQVTRGLMLLFWLLVEMVILIDNCPRAIASLRLAQSQRHDLLSSACQVLQISCKTSYF